MRLLRFLCECCCFSLFFVFSPLSSHYWWDDSLRHQSHRWQMDCSETARGSTKRHLGSVLPSVYTDITLRRQSRAIRPPKSAQKSPPPPPTKKKKEKKEKKENWSSRCFRRAPLLPHPGSWVIDQSKDISSLANRRKESGLVGRAPVRAVSNRCRALKVRFKFSTFKKYFCSNSPPTFNLPSLPFPLTIPLSALSVSTDHLPARKINCCWSFCSFCIFLVCCSCALSIFFSESFSFFNLSIFFLRLFSFCLRLKHSPLEINLNTTVP